MTIFIGERCHPYKDFLFSKNLDGEGLLDGNSLSLLHTRQVMPLTSKHGLVRGMARKG